MVSTPPCVRVNALERYIALPDPSYRWKAVAAQPGSGYTTHFLELVSQCWRDVSEVDRPRWQHELRLVVPDEIANDTALLVIAGGSNDKPAEAEATPLLAIAAMMSRSVTAELRMVPNQPLTFEGETDPRVEDGIIAYSWDKYLRTGDETWPLRLPMTKSVVRAMDAITEYCFRRTGRDLEIARFVLSGASKRGWTSWTAAAVDRRVAAVIPVVIDLLNIEASFEHHYRAYGFWAPAIATYQASGIMRWAGTAELASLLEIEDPFAYRARLNIPKFVINSAGDQYFLPDSSRFYFDALIGEKYLRYVPNTDHSLKGSDARESMLAFYHAVAAGQPRPKFSWSLAPNGVIEIKPATQPLAAVLWQAANPTARDFRLETIGPAYQRSILQPNNDGTDTTRVPEPARGWVAYFVELTFASEGPFPFKFTTEVRVVPETLPFGPPPEMTSAEQERAEASQQRSKVKPHLKRGIGQRSDLSLEKESLKSPLGRARKP